MPQIHVGIQFGGGSNIVEVGTHDFSIRWVTYSPGFSLESHQTENIFMVGAHASETSMSTFSLKAVWSERPFTR